MTGQAETLRALLAKGFFAAPGIYDALSARIVESLGFRAAYLAGNALGLHLGAGQPFVTLTETVEGARRVLGAIDIPLIVDAGAGFGEPAHVHRATRELERAGIAAIHFDDQPYPKRAAYHRGHGGLTDVSRVAAKFAVAAESRRSEDFLLIARTDCLKVSGSIEQTIERCVRYVAAGADALMVLNLAPEQVALVRDAVPRTPLAWFATPSDAPPSAAALKHAGFALALYPFDTVGAVADAVRATWAEYAATGLPAQRATPLTRTAKEVQELIGMGTYWAIEERGPN